MRLSRLNLIASFFLAAILCAPAWGATPALPGTLNYVEGQAVIGTETLNAKSVGTVNLEAGQTLTTQTGKVEVLLTPGVFFRLGNDSSATLVSPSLTNTEVALSHGEAMVEVAEIHQDNLLRVTEGGATTQLLKTGVYGFDANSGNVQVFKGEALVRDGDHQARIKGGHQFKVNQTASLKAAKFDKSEYQETDLYRFSNLRSEYLAEANVDAAIAYGGGPGWYGAGWYWDPLTLPAYTWIPGDGYFFQPVWLGVLFAAVGRLLAVLRTLLPALRRRIRTAVRGRKRSRIRWWPPRICRTSGGRVSRSFAIGRSCFSCWRHERRLPRWWRRRLPRRRNRRIPSLISEHCSIDSGATPWPRFSFACTSQHSFHSPLRKRCATSLRLSLPHSYLSLHKRARGI